MKYLLALILVLNTLPGFALLSPQEIERQCPGYHQKQQAINKRHEYENQHPCIFQSCKRKRIEQLIKDTAYDQGCLGIKQASIQTPSIIPYPIYINPIQGLNHK